MLLLLRIDVEYVMEPPGGSLLFGGVVLVHVQFLGENESALGRLVVLVVKVQQYRPTTRFELATHEERVVVARFRRVVDLLFDLAERRSSAADLLMTVWFGLDLCMISYVYESCITVDLGWGQLRRSSVGGV